MLVVLKFELLGELTMSRERFAELIRWPAIIWFIGLVNPTMMIPQLYSLWTTGLTAGLAMGTIILIAVLQGAFSAHGFFIRDRLVMWSNGLACIMSVITVLSVLYFRV